LPDLYDTDCLSCNRKAPVNTCLHLCMQVRHELYQADFTSHLSEEEQQKQAEAEFKVLVSREGCRARLYPSRKS